jgi:outer membrane murein-binding lipoprotein Lpp
MSTREQKIASALAQINECLYDHGAGKYQGAVSAQQRNQAFDNAKFLAAEMRRLSAENEALRAQTMNAEAELAAEALRNENLRRMIKGYQDELAGLRAQVEALTKHIRPVYLVATGEVHEGQETYTRHDAPVPMADQEVLFTRPPEPLTRPAVKYVPIAADLRNSNGNHPNDNELRTPECIAVLDKMGDDVGQGLDGYWKWGFAAGFNAALSPLTRPAVPEGWSAGVEAVAKMLDKKADDYAMAYGHDDMGDLSFGSGPHAQAKLEYHSELIELAEEVRAMYAAAPQPEAQPTDHHANCPEPVDEIEAAEREHMGCAHCKTGIYAEAQPTEAAQKGGA